MQVMPYLIFEGRCEEAIEFYQKAVGARVEEMVRFSEAPEPPPPDMVAPGSERKILHSSFLIGDTMVMASDGYCKEAASFKGFSLSLNVETPEEVDRYFNALVDGGQVTMPLGATFWSKRFGMLTDRFGIGWMVNCVQPV